uniref:TBC1 domain family, member 10b n=1 Tax=Lates calcarifer TaxID=8187 RepID=A0A4W6CF17_LATCA
MAELSTLSPSPPALGDPHAAPSIPPSSAAHPAPNSPAPESIPKSALYNDKALTGNTLAAQSGASLMSGTLESLSGLGEDGSSVGSDSEINGLTVRRTDKYGFLGGSQYSESGEKEIRVEVARQREMKWIDMFNNWDKWIKHRFQKVKLRCRKGIPSSLRAKAWQLLSNSQELLEANKGKFEELEREQGEAKWLDIIEKDLHRQFPFHEMFAARGGHGQQDLYRILKAYTIYRPDEGYCQAQAPVAAVLLMHMPAELFGASVQICEKYLPGYYSAGLEAIQLDGEIFFSLLRRTCPMAYRHLKKFKIDPILYMTEWFMCIFSRTLPWACVLRVWDMFFCEGVKIVFRVGLVLLKQMLGSVDKLRELQGMYETMERLRNISPDSIREDILVQEIITLPVTESLIERECGIQVRKWRESRGELTHQPGRRLHGTRAIYEYKRRAASISSGGSFSFLGSPGPPTWTTQGLLQPPLSPLVGSAAGSSRGPAEPSEGTSAQGQPAASAPAQSTPPPPSTLSPSPKIVSEQITPYYTFSHCK